MSEKVTKRIVKSMDFSKDTDHIALVSVDQGGPANGVNTLLVKSKDGKEKSVTLQKNEVALSISFRDFLIKFFNMWEGDAEQLCQLLGYTDWHNQPWVWDGDIEWADNRNEGITLLKSAYKNLSKGSLSDWIESLGETEFLELVKAKEDVEKATKSFSLKAEGEDKESAKPSVETDNEEDSNMDEQAELLKAELEKSKQEREALMAELQKSRKDTFTTLVKGYSFIEEDKVSGFVDVLIKAKEAGIFDEIQAVLVKAQAAVDAVVDVETGVTSDPVETLSFAESLQKAVKDLNKE